ncbi:MAG: hypothetical protein V2I33_22490 [Kangiellaceae bacterium]|nr:hypothetical protein [Kangiellaceae bacterium]
MQQAPAASQPSDMFANMSVKQEAAAPALDTAFQSEPPKADNPADNPAFQSLTNPHMNAPQ